MVFSGTGGGFRLGVVGLGVGLEVGLGVVGV